MSLLFSAYTFARAKTRQRDLNAGGVTGRADLPACPQRRVLLTGAASVLALGGFAGALLSACGGEHARGEHAQDAPTPSLPSVTNFRDVGGKAPGYTTSCGRYVRRAWCYRADPLTPNATDAATLRHMGLACVYDLRTPAELNRVPDSVPGESAYVALNVLGTSAPPSFAGVEAADLDAAMQAHWRELVTGRAQCEAYGALLRHMANASGPQLICGGTGVDVAGWASALLLLIANVPLEIIVKDFLLTNAWRSKSANAANIAPPVQQSYLQAAFDALQAGYGDLNRYLAVGLGLGSETVNALRRQLLV